MRFVGDISQHYCHLSSVLLFTISPREQLKNNWERKQEHRKLKCKVWFQLGVAFICRIVFVVPDNRAITAICSALFMLTGPLLNCNRRTLCIFYKVFIWRRSLNFDWSLSNCLFLNRWPRLSLSVLSCIYVSRTPLRALQRIEAARKISTRAAFTGTQAERASKHSGISVCFNVSDVIVCHDVTGGPRAPEAEAISVHPLWQIIRQIFASPRPHPNTYRRPPV